MKFVKRVWHYITEPENYGDYQIEWLISLILFGLLAGLIYLIATYGDKLLGTWG